MLASKYFGGLRFPGFARPPQADPPLEENDKSLQFSRRGGFTRPLLRANKFAPTRAKVYICW